MKPIQTVLVAAGALSLTVSAAWWVWGADARAGAAAAAGEDLGERVAALTSEVAELRAALALDPVRALARLPIPQELTFCDQPIPLDRPAIREAVAYELVLTVGRPTMPLLWMRRAPALLPMIEAKLRERGLPDDLKYVAMVESDLRWAAESPAGALGLWQFTTPTGRRAGLTIDARLDERLDPEAATDAALVHLGALRRQFGDWNLALAAYNAGEARVDRALADQAGRNYFDLYLPYETRRYLPRLAAAKLVFEQPEKYGLFRMAPLHWVRNRTLTVTAPRTGLDLRSVARERGLSYGLLRTLNPQFRSSTLPPGRWALRIPESHEQAGAVIE